MGKDPRPRPGNSARNSGPQDWSHRPALYGGDLPDRPSPRKVGLVPSQICRVAWGVGSHRPGLGARAAGAECSGEDLAQGSRVAPNHSEEDCRLRKLRSNRVRAVIADRPPHTTTACGSAPGGSGRRGSESPLAQGWLDDPPPQSRCPGGPGSVEAVATLKETLSRGPTLMVYYDILANSYVSQWASQQGADSHTLEQALAAAQ